MGSRGFKRYPVSSGIMIVTETKNIDGTRRESDEIELQAVGKLVSEIYEAIRVSFVNGAYRGDGNIFSVSWYSDEMEMVNEHCY